MKKILNMWTGTLRMGNLHVKQIPFVIYNSGTWILTKTIRIRRALQKKVVTQDLWRKGGIR